MIVDGPSMMNGGNGGFYFEHEGMPNDDTNGAKRSSLLPEDGGSGGSAGFMGDEDEDMMDYMNFEDAKNDYSSMLFPPGEQDAILQGVDQDDELGNGWKKATSASPPMEGQVEYTMSYKDAQEKLSKSKFGKVYDKPGLVDPAPRSEDLTDFITGNSSTNHHKFELFVGGFPLKSRVETQIKCRVALSPPPSECLMHLPTDTIARPKFQLAEPFESEPGTLQLEVDVVSESNPQQHITICERCMNREKKRAFRKKHMDPNEEFYWSENRKRRLTIFNCKELVPFSQPKTCDFGDDKIVQGKELEIPLRLACYCRHHAAKEGFRLVFTVRDCQNVIVGRNVTKPIFITDDHKDSKIPGSISNNGTPIGRPQPPSPASIGESSEAFSDQSSTYSLKRRREDDWNGSTRMGYQHSISRNSSSKNINGRHPDLPSPQSSDGLQMMPGPLTQLSPKSGGGNMNGGSGGGPMVQRIIPAQGSVRGGVEVTLLGAGFQPGLTAMFGDKKSTQTQCWSESTIVAVLPPAHAAGPVVVSFDGVTISNPQIFTYVDDTDRQLIELALQVVGMKMNGKLEDARNIAMRIVQQDDDGNNNSGDRQNSTSASPPGDHENVILRCIELVQVADGKLPNWQLRNPEGQTMMHLASALGYTKVVNTLISLGAQVDCHDINGMSPLQFGAMHGQRVVVEKLVGMGADPFHMANNGMTAMDMASGNLHDILPMAMSRREYTQYWVSRRNDSSSSTLDSVEFARDVVDGFGSQPQFDVWDSSSSGMSSSDDDSGYENDLEDDDEDALDSEDERLVQYRERQKNEVDIARESEPQHDESQSQEAQSSPTRTAAQNISNYFTQLSNNARYNWDRRWDDVLNYIYRPNNNNNNNNNNNQHRMENNEQSNDAGSDSDSTISPQNNITRVWKYFMPPPAPAQHVPEDRAPPRYEEIFPETAGDSSATTANRHPQPAPSSEKEREKARHQQQAAVATAAQSEDEDYEQKYLEQWTTKRKQLRNDRMLFMFWLPVLVAMILVLVFKYTGVMGFDTARRAKLEEWGNQFREVLAYYLLGRNNGGAASLGASTDLTVIEKVTTVIPARLREAAA